MWKLTPPDVNNVEDHLNKVFTKTNDEVIYDLSTNERIAVLAVYRAYDALHGQPDSSLKPAELVSCRGYIREGYKQIRTGGRLAVLRDALFASIINCPYCGFGEPAQLDHYLPKSQYDELAIYPRNLIPSCGYCNQFKGTIVPGNPSGSWLIHPYFQNLPEVKFLQAKLKFTTRGLSVKYRIDPTNIDSTLARMLQFQLERLQLNSRYPKQINKFISEQRWGMMRNYRLGTPPDQFSSLLLDAAKDKAGDYGINDWRPVLLEGLAANKNFCARPDRYFGNVFV